MQIVSRPTEVIAVAFAFAAFAVVLISGLAAGRSAQSTLFLAILAMIVGRVAGQALGAAAQIAVREHTEAYKAARPVPDLPDMDADAIEVGEAPA